jgi:hypothetical protein
MTNPHSCFFSLPSIIHGNKIFLGSFFSAALIYGFRSRVLSPSANRRSVVDANVSPEVIIYMTCTIFIMLVLRQLD